MPKRLRFEVQPRSRHCMLCPQPGCRSRCRFAIPEPRNTYPPPAHPSLKSRILAHPSPFQSSPAIPPLRSPPALFQGHRSTRTAENLSSVTAHRTASPDHPPRIDRTLRRFPRPRSTYQAKLLRRAAFLQLRHQPNPRSQMHRSFKLDRVANRSLSPHPASISKAPSLSRQFPHIRPSVKSHRSRPPKLRQRIQRAVWRSNGERPAPTNPARLRSRLVTLKARQSPRHPHQRPFQASPAAKRLHRPLRKLRVPFENPLPLSMPESPALRHDGFTPASIRQKLDSRIPPSAG